MGSGIHRLVSPLLQRKPARQVLLGTRRRFTCAQFASVLSPQVLPVIAFQGNRGVSGGLGCVKEMGCGENRRGLREGTSRREAESNH